MTDGGNSPDLSGTDTLAYIQKNSKPDTTFKEDLDRIKVVREVSSRSRAKTAGEAAANLSAAAAQAVADKPKAQADRKFWENKRKEYDARKNPPQQATEPVTTANQSISQEPDFTMDDGKAAAETANEMLRHPAELVPTRR